MLIPRAWARKEDRAKRNHCIQNGLLPGFQTLGIEFVESILVGRGNRNVSIALAILYYTTAFSKFR